MGIAKRVLVFAIFGYTHAVFAHQDDRFGIEGQTAEENEQFGEDGLNHIVEEFDKFDKVSRSGDDESQEEVALGARPGEHRGTICTANCAPPQQSYYCNGWPIVGQPFPCLGGFGQCVTFCTNCGQQPNRPFNIPPGYSPNSGPGAIYLPGNGNIGQDQIDVIYHQPTHQQPIQPPNHYIPNNGGYYSNSGSNGQGGGGGSYVINGGDSNGGLIMDDNGGYGGGGGSNGYIIDGNNGNGPGGYIINGNGGNSGSYGSGGCIISNNCGNNGVVGSDGSIIGNGGVGVGNDPYVVPPNNANIPPKQQAQSHSQPQGQQSQSQSQSQSGSGGTQSQSQSQSQIGRIGLPVSPVSDDKHAVRNNIRLRIYA